MDDEIEIAKNVVKDVSHNHYFNLTHGKVLKNLFELEEELGMMDDKFFHHHVSAQHNDFANWIRHVIKDEKLADEIQHIKTKETMKEKIYARRIYLKNLLVKESLKNHEKDNVEKVSDDDIADVEESSDNSYDNDSGSDSDGEIKLVRKRLDPPKRHEYLRGEHEHIKHKLAEFIYGAIFGAILMLIAMKMFSLL